MRLFRSIASASLFAASGVFALLSFAESALLRKTRACVRFLRTRRA